MPLDPVPLRLLQVCSARQAVYGAALSLLTLARIQRRRGHHVEFATFRGQQFGQQVRGEGFPAHEWRVRVKVDPFAIAALARLIRARRIEVVHTHLSTSSVNGTLAARLAKVPCLATVHGLSGKLSFVAANRLIAVSEQVKSHLMAQGIPAERIDVVYNGLEFAPEDPDADEARLRLGLAGAGPILGTVARVTSLKGVEDGIRTVALLRERYPQIRYLVVGDGDALSGCQELARHLGLQDVVHFTGYQADVRPYLSAMDLFLFPSHREAMGIALVEAMAAGLPVVATRVGGIPEVVTPDVGLLAPAQDVASLARAADEILSDLPTRVEMGAKARLRARNVFSAEAMAQGTLEVYERLLGRPLQGAPAPSGSPDGLRRS